MEARSTSPQKAAAAAAGKPLSIPKPDESAIVKPSHSVQRRPYRGWLLPHGVTCSCITYDGTMLAFGLKDGSTVVWDDQFGEIQIGPKVSIIQTHCNL